MDSIPQKWIKWLEVIEAEIAQLVTAKDVFWSVQDLVGKNKRIQKPSRFYAYLGYTYAAYALMGIRRQVKIHKQSISLARLLADLADDPKTLSRNYYKSLYSGTAVEHVADKDFDRFCGADPEYVSPDMVERDLQELRKTARRCEKVADKLVAHRDEREPKDLPKFSELDECIEVLDKLYVKYYQVFHASSMESLEPTCTYDWLAVFDEPWRLPRTESDSN